MLENATFHITCLMHKELLTTILQGATIETTKLVHFRLTEFLKTKVKVNQHLKDTVNRDDIPHILDVKNGLFIEKDCERF